MNDVDNRIIKVDIRDRSTWPKLGDPLQNDGYDWIREGNRMARPDEKHPPSSIVEFIESD